MIVFWEKWLKTKSNCIVNTLNILYYIHYMHDVLSRSSNIRSLFVSYTNLIKVYFFLFFNLSISKLSVLTIKRAINMRSTPIERLISQ